eukprot:10758867-Alexandrium_andersonii.AAC.1
MHPSGASGDNCKAALGPAQFRLRTLGAMMHVMHGGLRMEADCSTDGHSADYALYFECLAM